MEKKKLIKIILPAAVICLVLLIVGILLLTTRSSRSADASSETSSASEISTQTDNSAASAETTPAAAVSSETPAAGTEATGPEDYEASASELAPPDPSDDSEHLGPDGQPVEEIDTGIQFPDVTPDYYCYDAVCWATSKGIASGTSDTTFSPDDACTRAGLVTFLWRLAGKPQAQSSGNSFTDVTDTGSDLYQAVMWAVEQGITSGTSDTTFSPDDAVTRAQAVVFLWRYAGQPDAAAADVSFTDVASSDTAYDAVMWAVSSGIASGTSDTTFSPDDPCTRGQVVTFLYRYTEDPDTPSSPS